VVVLLPLLGTVVLAATVPTAVIVPVAVAPSGRLTDTGSPARTRAVWSTGRATLTTGVVVVTSSTGWPPATVPPTSGWTAVTRSAAGSKTTEPSARLPVRGRPSDSCSRSIAAVVAGVNVADTLSPSPSPRSMSAWSRAATSAPSVMPVRKARHGASVPGSRGTTSPSTDHSARPGLITSPAAGRAVYFDVGS